MHTPICDQLGCDVAVFALSHCRDMVAAVSRAGGFGVLGGSTFSPQQFETELQWVDEHTDGRGYGVDLLIPATYAKDAEVSPEHLEQLIPDEHRDFLERLLAEHGVPELDPDERSRIRHELAAGRGAMTPDGSRRLIDEALEHPHVNLVVSALGTPPPDVVDKLKLHDVLVGALCGKARHAEKHLAAGVDVVVAQGTEAGGHTGMYFIGFFNVSSGANISMMDVQSRLMAAVVRGDAKLPDPAAMRRDIEREQTYLSKHFPSSVRYGLELAPSRYRRQIAKILGGRANR